VSAGLSHFSRFNVRIPIEKRAAIRKADAIVSKNVALHLIEGAWRREGSVIEQTIFFIVGN
jgi:uncharacterized protein (DUF1778 family)